MPDPSHSSKSKIKSLVLITGMSGAGKSTASKALEDAGYFCIENLPVMLLADVLNGSGNSWNKLALVMDARDQDFICQYEKIIKELKSSCFTVEVIFIEADENILLQRFSEVRRKHPFSGKSVREDIRLEKQKLAPIKLLADNLIDTSHMTPHALRNYLLGKYIDRGKELQVSLISFGFKHGLPAEADILFDVRFLPNPYFVPDLKMRTGLEEDVAAYVIKSDASNDFFKKLMPLLEFLLPQYRQEGKVILTIAIGCTGGQHRSVAVTEKLKRFLLDSGEDVTVYHRDLG